MLQLLRLPAELPQSPRHPRHSLHNRRCFALSREKMSQRRKKVGPSESSTDQRKVSLTLTPAGEQLHAQVAVVEQQFSTLVSSWGEQADVEAVMGALWQFVRDLPAGRALARRLGREES
jgi:hypothetical protein